MANAVSITDDAGHTVNVGSDGSIPVTVSSMVPGTGATSLGKAEDDAHASGDVGVMALGVRQNSAAALGANGDYMPFIVDANGALWTNVNGVPADPYGVNADAASASGSISAKLRGIATALGVTALDLGSGTGGTRTLRSFLDTAQFVGGAGSVSSATRRVTLASDDPAVAELQKRGYMAQATFTPAAASHVAGDVNGGAQEFASIGPSGGNIMITSARLLIAGGTAEATAWFLYLFNVTPPSAVADDSPHTLPSGDRASYLGKIALGTAIDEVDTQAVDTEGINKQIKLSGTSVFGYLVNGTTLTPANVAHTVTLNAVAV